VIAAARPATLPEVWDALERWRERIDADALGGSK
jgi:hypothetical protein